MPTPPVDYTSKDYAAFVADMKAAIPTRLAEWTNTGPNDFGIVLLELWAYVGDILSFYGDRIANEAFLDTAVLRSSVLAIAKMLDYKPTQNLASTATVTFAIVPGNGNVLIPAGTPVSTLPVLGEEPVLFETTAAITVIDSTPWQGSVAVTQGKTSNDALGISNGSPDQVFQVFGSPVVNRSEHVFVNEIGTPVEWTYIEHLIDAGLSDNVYTTFTDENGVLNVVFGDNVNGRIPPNTASITVTYRVGGGSIGNVGPSTISTLVVSIANVSTVTNTSAAQGGADAESLDQIRVNAPRALTALDRAVTIYDYATLALKVDGVAKAKAESSVYTSVNLYLSPRSSSPAPLASATLKQQVLDYLAPRKMINATVTIIDPTYVTLYIRAAVNVLPTYIQEGVRLAVVKALTALLAYDNVDFAARVTLSSVYHAINQVPGVDYATVSVLSRTDGSGLGDVQLSSYEIPVIDPDIVNVIKISATGGITAT